MKKLLIAIAVMAVAGISSAATFDWAWTAKSGRLYDGNGSDQANRYAGTGYLINGALKQATLLAAFYDTTTTVDANYLANIALSTGSFASGRMNMGSWNMDAASEFDAYFVVLSSDGKGIYFSDSPTFDIQSVGTSTAIFGNQNDYSSSFKAANASYSGAGWYAVPEPTSGLLLLIGMAGLALKRKRA